MPKPQTFDSIIEVYGHSKDVLESSGTLKDLLDKKAQQFWQNSAKLYNVGKSVQMLQIVNDPTESLFIPQGTQTVLVKEKEAVDTPVSKPVQQSPQAVSELLMLQEELKGKLRAGDTNIKEIVEKISALQANLEPNFEGDVVPSLEYYMTVASDFTKLIRSLLKEQKPQASKIFRDIEPDLSQMAFEVFKRFVVYDQGTIVKQDALSFISECLYPVMTKEEKREVVFSAIDAFLAKPQTCFS